MEKEVEMTRRICLAVLCIAVLSTATAMADIGSVFLTLTPITVPGSLDVDLQVDVSTTGAASPIASDPLVMVAAIYYPTPWGSRTTTDGYTTTVLRVGTSNLFSHTFQLTAPFAGEWGTYAFAFGFGAAGTYNYDYTFGGVVLLNEQGIPTVTPLGIAILGALMAGIGIVILRRT
jgi:hypothetical protein